MPDTIVESRVAALAADFDLFDSWDDRIAYVIDLGRRLAPLAEGERTDAAKVRGCASQVWLVAEPSPVTEGGIRFRAQSDAAISQGLVALLTGLFSDLTPRAILDADPDAILSRLGLAKALTAQRANGLASMVKRIRAYAQAAL